MKVNPGYYIIMIIRLEVIMMNSKLKLIVNVLPVVLVPLFSERKKIKEHPDIEKLNTASKSAYSSVKDKSVDTANAIADTAGTIKDKSVSAYETGKYTYDVVSDKISETKQNMQQKKELKHRRKKAKENNTADHYAVDEHLESAKVPKMMQSHTSMLSNEEKTRGMLVSDAVMQNKPFLLESPAYRESNTQHPVIYDYDKEKWFDDETDLDEEQLALTSDSMDGTLRLENNTLQLEENDMAHTNVQEEYFKRVRNHEENIEAFNNSHLFLKHRDSLAPNLKVDDEEQVIEHAPLFQKHREQAESHIEKLGRKTSVDKNMKRSKQQQKLDGKLKQKQ